MSDVLALPIDPADIAAATLARHRRMATASGSDPAVVDAPAYRATLARTIGTAWPSLHGTDAALAQQVADHITSLPMHRASDR